MNQPFFPTVSVVITCYNYGHYLSGCLDSVLAQTYRDYEIIVVDDGSTDGTSKVMSSYAEVKNIRYVRQNNGGQANAKNRGIKESKGAFIAFLDADDLWREDKLEKQIQLFSNPSVGVVFSRTSYMDQSGEKVDFVLTSKYLQPSSGKVSNQLFLDNFIPFSSSVVRRECIEALGGFDEILAMGIDWDLWLRFSTMYEFSFIDEPLLVYRMGHPGQMSKNLLTRQQCTDRIMADFLTRFPGIVEESIVTEANYYTYCNRGTHFSGLDKGAAFKYFFNAMRLKPFYLQAYKSALKLLVPGCL